MASAKDTNAKFTQLILAQLSEVEEELAMAEHLVKHAQQRLDKYQTRVDLLKKIIELRNEMPGVEEAGDEGS